jgi:hypothetical protein
MLFDTSRRPPRITIDSMNRRSLRLSYCRRAATTVFGGFLLAGCNSVVPVPGRGSAPGAAANEPLTIEHTSLRSRISVYESALRACKQRGHDQAIFQTQVNEDPQRPPATGPQLSTFVCR